MAVFDGVIPAIVGAANAAAAGGYEIERSLRFNSADTAYLNRTPSSASNRRTFTWSGWCKRSKPSNSSTQYLFATSNAAGNDYSSLFFGTSDNLTFQGNNGSGSVQFNLISSAVYRDVSAWYHIVLSVDSTQTTSSDRIKLYVNGQQIDSFGTETYPSQNFEFRTNSAEEHGISFSPNFTTYFDGYLAEVHFIDGQALAATDFGEYDDNNVWQPKEFTGTYDRGANQSQVWSTTTTVSFYGNTQNGNTSTIADVFDGSESTGYYVIDSTVTGSAGLCYKLTFPSGVRGSRVRFRTGGDAGAAAALNTEVVGSLVGGSAYTWYTIYEGAETDIDYIVFGNNDSGTRNNITTSIEIDGKLLVDSGISLTDNSFYLNFSDNSSAAALGTDSSGNSNTWTVNNITASAEYYVERITASTYAGAVAVFGNTKDNIFDGSNTTGTYLSTSNAYIQFEPQTPIAFTTSVEVYTGSNGDQCQVDLGSGYGTATSVPISTWTSVATGPGTLHGLRHGDTSGAPQLNAIRIDGTILSGNTPASDIDSLIDSPTNYTADSGNNGGNYATFSELISTSATISNGALDLTSGANYQSAFSSFGLSSGKWYFEGTVGTFASDAMIGVGSSTQINTATFVGNFTDSICYAGAFGRYWEDGTQSGTWGDTFTSGDTVSCAFDVDSGKIWFAKNGVWQASGDPAAGTNPASTLTTGITFLPGFAAGSAGTWSVNFGQRPFVYTPPTGYVSLCTQNLSDPTIADGGTSMNAALYTGNGASNSITGLGFAPDILWLKSRSNTSIPALANSVVGPYYFLRTNDTNAESGPGFNDDIVSFDSDGFTLGADTYYAFCNLNTYTYVGWAWDSGTTTGSNTDGTITSQVRANQTAGCSIVSYTADATSSQTIGHGLNAKPGLIIVKDRDAAINWSVYHQSLDITSGEYLKLNTTEANLVSNSQYNSTEATTSVFTVGSGGNTNYQTGNEYIAFCFAPVEGYSAFGSYTGNGDADGPFVFTGFRPKWVLRKCNSTGGSGYDWVIIDTERNLHNISNNKLYPNYGGAENVNSDATDGGDNSAIDILSNGFKVRASNGRMNQLNQTFIYAAFAEHPFKSARAR